MSMNTDLQKIAERLRALRQILDIDVEEMANVSGITVGEYLRYESGEIDFNFTFLFRCASRLGVDISELVTGEQPTLSFYNVVRNNEGMPIKRRAEFDYQHMSYLLKHRLAEPFVVTAKYSEKEDHSPIHLSTHDGQEFDYVLEGSLKVQLEDHLEVLHAGDSVMYDSSKRHGMVATDGKDAKFLAVVIRGEGKAKPALQTPIASYREHKYDELIYKQFVSEITTPDGNLVDLKFNAPLNFNFGFDVVDALAKKCPDKAAMVWLSKYKEARTFSFDEMSKLSSKTANYFKGLGIKKGDRVMLVLKRHYQFWLCMVALHKLGAVAIPATNQLKSHDFEYRFEAAGVKAVVCTPDDGVCESVDEAITADSTVQIKCVVGGAREGWLDFDAGILACPDTFSRPFGDDAFTAEDPMLMYFTSGTTGYPKIATHNYYYALGHVVTARYWHNVDPEGLHFTISDTGWGKAVWGKLYGQWLCEACVFTYDFDRFHAADILPLFKDYGITTFCAPPTMYRFFIKEDLSQFDLSSLQYCTIAGEALNPEVYQQWLAATGIKLMEGFGQTETTLTVCNLVGMEPKPGSMGKPNPQYHVDLYNAEGESAKIGEVGEIVIKTDKETPFGMFVGYYQNAEKTDAVWYEDAYHTGDMAWRDEDGYFWYVGRTDDLIKSSGYRIGPFEIESVIMELPYVLECAITGVPDPTRGQIVKATVVLVSGKEETEELKKEIQVYVKDRTAPYKYPRIVEFVEELPKTISGKIRRVELRK